MDFVEICNVCTRKVIIKAAKRIFNSDKICCSYYGFYFGVTFLEHTVFLGVKKSPETLYKVSIVSNMSAESRVYEFHDRFYDYVACSCCVSFFVQI